MRGDTVVVRLHKGQPKVLKVWAEHADAVEVTTLTLFAQAAADEQQPLTIGVPWQAVFELTDEVDVESGIVDWSVLTPRCPNPN